jgi:hypothetical protein
VYNLAADQDQSQLLHKIIKESYSGQLQHNYLYDQQVSSAIGQGPAGEEIYRSAPAKLSL